MVERPAIATYWIGGALRRLDRLSLSSFLHLGHPVTLYVDGDPPARIPDGVQVAAATGPVPEMAEVDARLSPAIRSDIFRTALIRRRAVIWADTDVICLRPLAPRGGYLLGRQEGSWINTAVLAVPPDSAAYAMLEAAFRDPAAIFPWLGADQQAVVQAVPVPDRQARTAALSGNAFGPLALTHALTETGEDRQALPMAALNPLPWWLGDLYFDPRGSLEAWTDDSTLVLHLYASRLRPLHKRRRPPMGSPLARIARRIGFDDFS